MYCYYLLLLLVLLVLVITDASSIWLINKRSSVKKKSSISSTFIHFHPLPSKSAKSTHSVVLIICNEIRPTSSTWAYGSLDLVHMVQYQVKKVNQYDQVYQVAFFACFSNLDFMTEGQNQQNHLLVLEIVKICQNKRIFPKMKTLICIPSYEIIVSNHKPWFLPGFLLAPGHWLEQFP